MRKLVQFFRAVLLLLFFNNISVVGLIGSVPVKILLIVGTLIHAIAFVIFPQKRPESKERRLIMLSNGACILGYGLALVLLEIPALMILARLGADIGKLIGSGILSYFLIFILNLIGMIRITAGSRQFKLLLYILLFMTWFIPLVNCIVLIKFYKHARSEFRFEQAKLELDDMRAENQVCRTKYPIIMVHGIFFRDWQVFNYWGRIPKALAKNGANVSYASQQSANTVEESAREIAIHIENIIKMSKAEKVNIIAHSKGGLDCRYAISRLGMDKYVASLTTINTPHRGCEWVDRVLAKAPQGLAEFLEGKYNALFTKLGDSTPHFLLGVNALTKSACEQFNREVPDMPGVKYTSIMSKMVSPVSAGFPLNVGYYLCRPECANGNDGLVSYDSALYWQDSRVVPITKHRGISHGDMIDLMRENIDGFDVREYYVQLVKELKEQGY